MKLLVVAALCVVACTAAPARLDNNYLPPGSAGTAGGNGNFLSAPGSSGGHQGGGGGQYQGGGGGQYHGGASARNPQNDVPILRLDNENNGDGSYRYAYETGNGIQAEEAGQQRQLGTEEVNQVQGSYSYTGDDGQQYTVTYVADENGFQPQGAHLPTPPPIPEAILRSLEQNAAEEARGGDHGDDGQYNEGAHGGQANNGGFNSNAGYRY